MIHHKNLKKHFKQETYREWYMIFLLIVGQTNTLILVTMQKKGFFLQPQNIV